MNEEQVIEATAKATGIPADTIRATRTSSDIFADYTRESAERHAARRREIEPALRAVFAAMEDPRIFDEPAESEDP